MTTAALDPTDESALAAIRAGLDRAAFHVDAVEAALGDVAAAALQREDPIPARRLARRPDASATLVVADLFLLGGRIDRARLESAVGADAVAAALAIGLVADEHGVILAHYDLRPYAFTDAVGSAEWWVLSDLGELATGGPLRPDHVLGVGGASLTLVGLQFTDPVERVLDLGTGCGIQAMHAARHADVVVATDVSARALAIAAFNAALNRVDGIELRLGSLFEPVTGADGVPERFDRIISNPPFVITPRGAGVTEYEYRDGGRSGDDLVAGVVAALVDHLRPGGTAQLLGNWESRVGDAAADGLERAAGWAPALDRWIIERDRIDPAAYAQTWSRDGGALPGTAEHTAMVTAWLDDFEARDVAAIGFGYLLFGAPDVGADRPPVVRTERVGTPLADGTALGVVLEPGFAALRELAALDDVALAQETAIVAADVTEERHLLPGEDEPSAILLRQGGGLQRVIPVGTATAAAVGACDGELTIGAIVGALADLLEVPTASVAAEVLPAVRDMLVTGFLSLRPAG